MASAGRASAVKAAVTESWKNRRRDFGFSNMDSELRGW